MAEEWNIISQHVTHLKRALLRMRIMHEQRDIVTGSGKTDLMGILAQIELLVSSELAAHCALVGIIDVLIGTSVVKL